VVVGCSALAGCVVGVGAEDGACAALCDGEVLYLVGEICGVRLRGVSESGTFSWKGCRNLWKLHGKAAAHRQAQTRAPPIIPASASVACWTLAFSAIGSW
jgi:hypothetical protein